MSKLSNILVYEWKSWNHFLISQLVDERCRFQGSFEDDISNLEKVLTPDIDAVLFQVDLSLSQNFPGNRPELIEDLEDRGLTVLNGSFGDITKRNLHAVLDRAGLPSAKADVEGDPDEVLFIKSNLNAGGGVEDRLPETLAEKYRVTRGKRITKHDEYYVAPRREIEDEIWTDQTLVVERYIRNDENSFYRAYRFGESIIVVKAHASDLIKKVSGHALDRNFLFTKAEIIDGETSLPGKLQRVLSQFLTNVQIEYYALDIVHDNEDFYIIDLNLTPWCGEDEEEDPDAVHFLIQGITEYLEGKRVVRKLAKFSAIPG